MNLGKGKGRASSVNLLGLHRGKSEGKASGDNTLALPKRNGHQEGKW